MITPQLRLFYAPCRAHASKRRINSARWQGVFYDFKFDFNPDFPLDRYERFKTCMDIHSPKDEVDRDLSGCATAIIAHLASPLALLIVLAECSLRRPLA